MLNTFVLIIEVVNLFAGLAIIFLVLMQQGKGADAGAAFGGGSSQGLFGAAGSANFLSRSTAGAAIIFFVTCLVLAYSVAHRAGIQLESAPESSINTIEKKIPKKNIQPAALPDATFLREQSRPQATMERAKVAASSSDAAKKGKKRSVKN